MEDAFIREHLEGFTAVAEILNSLNQRFRIFSDLLQNIRMEVIIKMISPYTRVSVDFIATVKYFNNFIDLLLSIFSLVFSFFMYSLCN